MPGFLLALAFATCVGLVFYLELRWLVHRALRREPDDAPFWPWGGPGTRRALSVLLNAVAGIGLLCVLWGRFVEPSRLEVTRVVLASAKVRPETGRIRIVHLSDFHSEAKPFNEPRVVELVNSLKPDVVAVIGDFVNQPAGLPTVAGALQAMKPAFGVFAVTGNYDIGNLPDDAFRSLPVVLLESGARELTIRGTRVRVTGLSVENGPELRTVMKLLRVDPAYDILLFHYSDLIDQASKLGVDLYLAGHTHGGQVRLPWYGALVTLSATGKKYEAGFYQVGPTSMYVSRGIGTEGGLAPRVRFLCRPEITVIDVVPAPGAPAPKPSAKPKPKPKAGPGPVPSRGRRSQRNP